MTTRRSTHQTEDPVVHECIAVSRPPAGPAAGISQAIDGVVVPGRATKRLLMIDYYFPPAGGPGVQRTLGYVKHLDAFGWTPMVLTVQSGEYTMYDSLLRRSVPDDVVVQRAISIEPIRFVKKLLTWNRRRRDGVSESSSGRPLWLGSSRVRNVEHWILFPDRHIGWLPFALARAISLSRRVEIDVVYSTSTVMTSHLIAYGVKSIIRAPWVADFQDPWLEDYVSHFPTSWHRRQAERLEHLIMQSADRVVVSNEPHRQMILSKHQTIPPEKVVVIPMGFDQSVLKDIKHIPRRKFTMTHLGNFYGPRSPVSFLKALRRFLNGDERLAQEVEVLFLGGFDAEVLIETERQLDQSGLRTVVKLAGVVPHRVGLEYLASSHVLLLVTDNKVGGRNQIPTKLPEYLAIGRPILALAPEGEIAKIVRAANAGLVVPPDDVEAIQGAIHELYRRWKNGHLAFSVNQDVIGKLAWRELAGRLAFVLEDAMARATA